MSSSLREAITVARKELKDRPPRSLLPDEATAREAFNLASRDGSGLLRQRELRVAVKSLGLDIGKDWALHLIETSNNRREGGAGGVGFAEFLEIAADAAEACDATKDAINAFLLFKQKPAEGAAVVPQISIFDLIGTCEVMQKPPPNLPELQAMLDAASTDGVGTVDLDAFCQCLQDSGYFPSK